MFINKERILTILVCLVPIILCSNQYFTSTLLGSAELSQLKTYLNASSLSLSPLYASNGTYCTTKYKRYVNANTPNVLVVARTASGKLVGGFRKSGCKGNNKL